MNATSLIDGDTARVGLSGRFDAYAAPMVEATLRAVLSPGRLVMVDMSEVDFVDSTGLATLVQAMKTQRDQEGDVVIVRPTDAVRVILELTRLDRAFRIEPGAVE